MAARWCSSTTATTTRPSECVASRARPRFPSCWWLARRERAKHPAQLKLQTALRYSKALDAKDKGDKATAKQELQAVVKEQPDFRLAALDLDRLMQ